MAQEWRGRTDGRHAYVVIEGENIGWRGRGGHKVMSVDKFLDNPRDAIAPDTSDYNQYWQQDSNGKTLTIRQSHHDQQSELYKVRTVSKKELENMGYDEGDLRYS